MQLLLRRQRRAHRLARLRLRALLRHVRVALSYLHQPCQLVLRRLQLAVQQLEPLRLLRLLPPHVLGMRYGVDGSLAPLARLALGARQIDARPPHALVGKGRERPVEVGGALQHGGVLGLGPWGRRLELQLFVRVLHKLGLVSEEAQPVVRQKGVELGLLVVGGLPRLVRLRLRLESLLELSLVDGNPSARGNGAWRQRRGHGAERNVLVWVDVKKRTSPG